MNTITLTLSQKEYELLQEALNCYETELLLKEAELLLKSDGLTRIGKMTMAQHYADKRKDVANLIRWKFNKEREQND